MVCCYEILMLLLNKLLISAIFESIVAMNKRYGQNVVIWRTPITPKIITAHPQLVQKLLSTYHHLGKSKLYDFMVPFLGYGLVTSAGMIFVTLLRHISYVYELLVDVWKIDRKVANTAFNLKLMESYNKIFEYHGNELVDILSNEVGKKSVDLVPFVDLYALDVTCGKTENYQLC